MTLEDEEEEIDETDLSRPGPSHSEDSQNFGESRFYIIIVWGGVYLVLISLTSPDFLTKNKKVLRFEFGVSI